MARGRLKLLNPDNVLVLHVRLGRKEEYPGMRQTPVHVHLEEFFNLFNFSVRDCVWTYRSRVISGDRSVNEPDRKGLADHRRRVINEKIVDGNCPIETLFSQSVQCYKSIALGIFVAFQGALTTDDNLTTICWYGFQMRNLGTRRTVSIRPGIVEFDWYVLHLDTEVREYFERRTIDRG
jgi:hypothetical protein